MCTPDTEDPSCCDQSPEPEFPLQVLSEVSDLPSPRGGLPAIACTPEELSDAAARLARGHGPLAVDTERASAYRYNDRAFLIQLRRQGCGTVLIDPEEYRADVQCLAPVLNPLTWIIHSARTDLPCLHELGLYPEHLIDTELGGRIAGLEKVNLAAMVESLVGFSLAKGHGSEDWSTRPLPTSWVNYAALDVECLLELAETLELLLAELGRLDWVLEESEHVRKECEGLSINGRDWQSIKGLGRLKRPQERATARGLWWERDRIAKAYDRSPHRVLSSRQLVMIASENPRSPEELSRSAYFPYSRHAHEWYRAIERSRATKLPPTKGQRARANYAATQLPYSSQIPAYSGAKGFPRGARRESAERFHDLLAGAINDLSVRTGIPHETIIEPAIIRQLAWALTHNTQDAPWLRRAAGIDSFFHEHGARTWQRELATPACAQVLHGC